MPGPWGRNGELSSPLELHEHLNEYPDALAKKLRAINTALAQQVINANLKPVSLGFLLCVFVITRMER